MQVESAPGEGHEESCDMDHEEVDHFAEFSGEQMKHIEQLKATVSGQLNLVVSKIVKGLCTKANAAWGLKPADFSGLQISNRCLSKFNTDAYKLLQQHGFQKPITDETYQLPYQNRLGEDFCVETMTLPILANSSSIGRKVVPYQLVANVLESGNTEFLVPQNKIMPYNAQKLNCLFFGAPATQIEGDLARGIPFGNLWGALSPPCQDERPFSVFGTAKFEEPDYVVFDMVQALLTGRKCASFNRPTPLAQALYYDHPKNNVASEQERYDYCGNVFKCAKQLAELWNAMIHAQMGYPGPDTNAHRDMQQYLYSLADVEQVLAALSAIVHHDHDQACLDAELFYPGRARKTNHKDPRCHELQKHICFLTTPEMVASSRALYKNADTPMQQSRVEMSGAAMDQDGQPVKPRYNARPNRPARTEGGLHVRAPHEYSGAQFWNKPEDQYVMRRKRKAKKDNGMME